MKKLINKIKHNRTARGYLTNLLENKIVHLHSSDLHYVIFVINNEPLFSHHINLGRLFVSDVLLTNVTNIEKISFDEFQNLICELTVGRLFSYKYEINQIMVTNKIEIK